MSWILSWCCCCRPPFNKKIRGVDTLVQIATQRSILKASKSMVICLLWETHFSKPTLQTHYICLGVCHICTSAEEPSSNSSCSGCGVCGPVLEGWNRHDDPTNICQTAKNLPGQQRQTYSRNGDCKKFVDHGSFTRCNFSKKWYWDLA